MEDSKLQSIISQIDKLNTRLTNIEAKMGLTQPSIQSPKQFIGDKLLIVDKTESELLLNWLSMNDKSVHLNLLYHPSKGQDTLFKARSASSTKNPLLLIIETTDGCKFGGYKNLTWIPYVNTSNEHDYHMENWDIFLFSIDKKETYCMKGTNPSPYYPDTYTSWYNLFMLNQENFLTEQSKIVERKDEFRDIISSYNKGKDTYTVKELCIYAVNAS